VNLRERITKLEQDIAQAQRDRKLETRWKAELAAAQAQASHIQYHRPLPRDGVDYAFAHPAPAALVRAHATFVVRYIASGGGKDITREEAEDLSHAGLDIALVCETSAGFMAEPLPAFLLGDVFHAAQEAGMPHGRPVYFAHDEEGQIGPAIRFLRDAIDRRGPAQIGAYGGLAFIEAAYQAGVRYLWQTLAWSGTPTRWSPHAQLRQTIIETTVAGAQVDIDQALAADFGQWQVS
jgi:hypothetical protein